MSYYLISNTLLLYFIHSINSVYTSILISQFVSPSFPLWYPCVLYLCASFCFAYEIIYIIFLDSTYMHQYMIFGFFFVTPSLSMTLSRSTHVSSNDPMPFLFMAESYSIVCMYHIFFIHYYVDGHLGCFHA